jgi:coatomer subunit beta'
LKELAIQVTTDPDHKFDLALSLDDLDLAHSIVSSLSTSTDTTSSQQQQQQQQQQSRPDTTLTEPKWKSLGDSALKVWRFDLAKECFTRAGDLGSLLLLVLSVGDREGLVGLVDKASAFAFPFFVFLFLLIY